MGNPSRTAFILANLGSTLITLGDWREARSALKRAMDLVAASGAAADATGPLPYLGQLSMYEGKWDDAARYLEEGLTLACQAGDRQTQEMVETFLAEVDLAQGRPEAATERLDSFVEQSDSNLGLLLPLYAWAQLETGDADRAATSVRRAVSRTREHHERFNLVHALWVESMILARRRQFDEAQADVEAALSMARSMPYPFAEARLLYQEGLLHARQRDHGRARERLREALTVFERLGAQPSAETARQAVQALDSGSLDWEIEEVSSVPRHAEAV
jgi:tetratricopeptide (TPR) repeat protein